MASPRWHYRKACECVDAPLDWGRQRMNSAETRKETSVIVIGQQEGPVPTCGTCGTPWTLTGKDDGPKDEETEYRTAGIDLGEPRG